jgi:hypothetical protein
MKSILFALGLTIAATGAVSAQGKQTPKAEQVTPATTLTADNLQFVSDSHDFGIVQEGGAADYVFQFKNTGKEPIVISKVQPSCGCTVPDWSKDPILPGKTGFVKASYGTQGRPGHFEKSMTVFSNAGTKMVSFKGTVEKAPEASVPTNSSMIRTN